MVDFIMPENKRDDGENPIVDSLAVASKWTIVSKCALHGLIYVWDLKATIKVFQIAEIEECRFYEQICLSKQSRPGNEKNT